MTTIQKIQREMNMLPEQDLIEVWHFMLFLKSKNVFLPDETPKLESTAASTQTAWERLETIGQTLSAAWKPEKTAAAAITEVRR